MPFDIVPLQSEKAMLGEEVLLLRFMVFDSESKRSPADFGPLRVLVLAEADGRHGRGWAKPFDDGLYEVAFPAPAEGGCYLFFSYPLSGIGYAQLPHLILHSSGAETTVLTREPETTPADGGL
jgi:hypothetical protein